MAKFQVYIVHQMPLVYLKNKHASIIWCNFSFVNRGRLWCSWKILFRHWTWLISFVTVSIALHCWEKGLAICWLRYSRLRIIILHSSWGNWTLGIKVMESSNSGLDFEFPVEESTIYSDLGDLGYTAGPSEDGYDLSTGSPDNCLYMSDLEKPLNFAPEAGESHHIPSDGLYAGYNDYTDAELFPSNPCGAAQLISLSDLSDPLPQRPCGCMVSFWNLYWPFYIKLHIFSIPIFACSSLVFLNNKESVACE